jgi:hypothetical protein
MASYYDDNFGHYNIESEDDIEFFHHMQSESEWKECAQCERKVFISYRYAICNDCADKKERGMEF